MKILTQQEALAIFNVWIDDCSVIISSKRTNYAINVAEDCWWRENAGYSK